MDLSAEDLARMSRQEKIELMELIAERARRRLMPFVLYTKDDYQAGWFHEKLAAALEQFLQDVIDKKSPRMVIMAPPRHGKTELVSRRFPAFALGKYPDLPIIATSYSSDLASDINRDVQQIIDSEAYQELFPETSLKGTVSAFERDNQFIYRRTADMFDIVGHKGVYKSAGVGAGITGRGGRILLIDDPFKDAAEAHSETVRKGVWDWYTSTLYTRCEPGGGILLIMTRWHEDDLAGKILANAKRGGEQWTELRFPAIAEEDEEFRKKGEALHPERYDEKQLAMIKLGTEDEPGVGSRVWASLFQQRPSAAEGNIFLRENWRFLRPPNPIERMSDSDRRVYFRELGIQQVIQVWDTALGGKKKSDFAACVTMGIARSRYYVLDVWKEQLKFPDVLKQVELLYDKWQPNRVIVEGGGSASGKATVQVLGRQTRIPFKEHVTVSDKVFRAETVSPSHESGLVTIMEGGGWQTNFIDQCSNFPNLKNDDDVDAFILGLEFATTGRRGLNISSDLLKRVGA